MDITESRLGDAGSASSKAPDTNEHGAADARLGAGLSALPDQVKAACSRLAVLCDDLCEQQRSVDARDADLARRSAELDRQAAALENHRSTLTTQEKIFAVRVTSLEERARDLEQKKTVLETRQQSLVNAEDALRQQEIEVTRRADELEARLANREDTETQQQLATLAADLEARDAMLSAREQALQNAVAQLEHREAELETRSEELRFAAVDLAERTSAIRAREQTVEAFQSTLGRMQDAIAASSRDETSVAAHRMSDPAVQPARAAASGETDTATHATGAGYNESDETPPIDISDFSAVELATLEKRRSLRVYSDPYLAAEIRGERASANSGKKRRGWF